MKSLLHQKPLIGLLGGIGSGKSQVAAGFAKNRGYLIVADRLGHEALEQPDIVTSIAQRWGDRAFNEQRKVDRKKLGKIVFASPVERTNLEYLVFPWIEKRIREEIKLADANKEVNFIVLDAAIMLEAGWNQLCDKLIYIHAPRKLRLERLAQNRGWTAEDVEKRESAQMPLSDKAMRADVAIDNSGSLAETHQQVEALIRRWNLLD
jgi:dephospho-CoA kinase